MLTFKSTASLSDQELIARFRESGEQKWVGELFNRYAHLVLGLCMQVLRNEEDARDMCMQIFEKLLSELKKKEVEYFKSWLYTLSRNECLMLLRKRKQGKQLKAAEAYLETVQENEVAAKALKEVQLEELSEAMEGLNEQQRECVELFYLKQQSYEQVSRQTGYSMKEVKSHIQNGRRNLRNTLTTRDAFKS